MSDATQPLPASSAMPPGSFNAPPRGAAADLTGQTVGDFHILRRLGQGGMGQVYLAEQCSLKRKVALKFLRPDLTANTTALHRFRKEAESVARLAHGNIVQVYAFGEAAGRQYMALEYVEGRNLRDYLNRKGPLDLPVALSIMRQVAAALQRAAESGIVHRDIKPENILLTRKGEVKVADFGLSRDVSGEEDLHLTKSGTTLGTPLYMSPEQVQGQPLDPRSDIYSFGVTCYHMLAGQPPFRGQTPFDVALQHVQSQPTPLTELRPDLPPELCALIHRMMSKDPAQRPQSGREVLRELTQPRGHSGDNPFAGMTLDVPRGSSSRLPELPADATAPANLVRPPVPERRRRFGVILGVSVVLALFCGAGLRQLLGARAIPPAPPREDHPVLPVVSDNERFLLQAVKEYANPKADKVREGLAFHFRLGHLYLEQKRYAEAQRLFEDLAKRTDAPPQYNSLGTLGLAIVYALEDDTIASTRAFQELKVKNVTPRGPFLGVPLPPEDLINLKYWVLTAVERNATHGRLTGLMEKVRDELKVSKLRPPPPVAQTKGKAGP